MEKTALQRRSVRKKNFLYSHSLSHCFLRSIVVAGAVVIVTIVAVTFFALAMMRLIKKVRSIKNLSVAVSSSSNMITTIRYYYPTIVFFPSSV